MSVDYLPGYSRCRVRLQNGVDEDNVPVYVTRTINRIRPEASHADFYEVITALQGLQSLPVISLQRIDEGELIGQ